MDWSQFFSHGILMVVNYFDIVCIIINPAKTKPPLTINPDAELT